ncbi:rhodanese-like domain-containing protein [uncultured Marivita sp.]|uniref:rhodanese-like domain-containing protein n=1 Tax=uncultured Marivita sp. TaxID=888080 RepID=UPI0026213212|nr:rhodanese-like domain-containing protein [uncultured Marivita sp.]
MALDLNRRRFVLGAQMTMLTVTASPVMSQIRSVWSAETAFDALQADTVRIIDVRTRDEWQETGIGAGVWPISMHETGFPDRLFKAKELSGDRIVGLICATGGRSASLLRALRQAGYSGYADISEGMLGSGDGKGWIASGLPTVQITVALKGLPAELA